jgi:hypothetical protein
MNPLPVDLEAERARIWRPLGRALRAVHTEFSREYDSRPDADRPAIARHVDLTLAGHLGGDVPPGGFGNLQRHLLIEYIEGAIPQAIAMAYPQLDEGQRRYAERVVRETLYNPEMHAPARVTINEERRAVWEPLGEALGEVVHDFGRAYQRALDQERHEQGASRAGRPTWRSYQLHVDSTIRRLLGLTLSDQRMGDRLAGSLEVYARTALHYALDTKYGDFRLGTYAATVTERAMDRRLGTLSLGNGRRLALTRGEPEPAL